MVGICKNISEPRCGREFKRPLHRLVRQLRSSSLDPTTLGRKVQKRCARQTFFWFRTFRFFGHVWFVCGRLWEKSDACSLLFYRNKTRRERFFLPNLRHHNHQRLPSATIRKRKENGARLFTFWHRIKKNYRSGGNVCVCVSREIKIKKPPKNAFKLFRAACAYFILPFDGSS